MALVRGVLRWGMLPSADALSLGLAFLERRFRAGPVSRSGIENAQREAETLADGVEADEPAALFFALARRPRVLGSLWRRGPSVVANGHAQTLGLQPIPDELLRVVRMEIVRGRMSWLETKAWFRARWAPP